MFLLLPLQIERRRHPDGLVWANSLVIALNVLAYAFGWSSNWAVGRGSSILNVLLYGFAHASVAHLLANCWVLLVFGHAVNRRIGNGYYLAAYLGTVVAVGLCGWLFLTGGLVGASGGVFGVLAIAAMLLPAERMQIGYVALFPVTLLIGLLVRPKEWLSWFLTWGRFEAYVVWCLVLVPLLEVWGLLAGWWAFGYVRWTNLAHLIGFACGLTAVLTLPTSITMRRSTTLSA